MANQRKLGRTADQRKALLRNQVTNLIWYGRALKRPSPRPRKSAGSPIG